MNQPDALAAAVRGIVERMRGLAADLEALVAPVPMPANQDRPDVETRYIAYVTENVALGRQPSREQDHETLVSEGYAITREQTRELRRIHAPPTWQEAGRPPKSRRRNCHI